MLEALKELVCKANLLLPAHHLVTFTWGNVSGIDREKGLFVIKPSGVPYEELKPEDMVVMDLEGNRVEGELNPSSDTATHAELLPPFPGGRRRGAYPFSLGHHLARRTGYSRLWQPTHAVIIYGPVPCARDLTQEEVERAYELETGKVIATHFEEHHLNPLHVPCVLARHHGPFAWGKDPMEAVHNAVVLEEVAMMAWHTEALPKSQDTASMPDYVRDKHFLRKHGPNAYYGQKK